MYKDDLVYEFNDEMWNLYHDGTIDNEDDFWKEKHNWIESKTIYTKDNKEYVSKLNYDLFLEHDVFGLANNWKQAGYCAIYDLLNDHEDALTYDEMELQNENA
tara:strand:+ start:149 stop:457 length:309 start_codon:yes stop_codon:yes gene_type:complete